MFKNESSTLKKCNYKESFEVESKHGAFFTGGNIFWNEDCEYMFCQRNGTVSVLSVTKGSVMQYIGQSESQDEDTINTFAVDVNNDTIVTHHKSSLFKLWNWKDGKLLKIWKSIHKGPVSRISLQNNIMASGGSDSNVRLWDLQQHVCTHNLKGLEGVVSVLAFHPNLQKKLLFAAGDDTVIHAWNIRNGNNKLKLNGHFSKVTSLSFHEDGIHMVSSGRDKVLILWNIEQCTTIRVLPVYESIEDAFIIPFISVLPTSIDKKETNIYAASAGEKGCIKIWEMKSGLKVYEQNNSLITPAIEDGGLSVTHLLYNEKSNNVALVSVDHNIIIHSLETFNCIKQIVGYTDEVLDVTFIGKNDSHLAVATNSIDIKLYELATMNCQLLRGHNNLILSLCTTPANKNLLVSSDKDNTVRVWYMNEMSTMMFCIGVGTRHTAAVGSVALSQSTATFFVSVSQDSCLKLWDLPKTFDQAESVTLNAVHTIVAHEKDINSVTISPNDKLIATGSQDKTAKLWSTSDLQLLGVFRGHRRGIWCVRFSPVDQILLTTSADCTIRLWSLSELNCLKTMEGHESSVLRAEFLSRGMQIITTGGDGLLKLWSIKTSECITTLEEHDSRVWALAVNKKETHIISGGSDSLLIVWRDVTQEKKENAVKEREELALEEQKLANLLQSEKLTAALNLALKLEKPLHALRIIEGIIKRDKNELTTTICDLKPARQEELLKYAVTWNTNSRNAQVAQLVINALLNEIDIDHLRTMDLTASLEAMIPYTDRHFKRLTRLLQDLHLLNYTVNCMKPHSVPVHMEQE